MVSTSAWIYEAREASPLMPSKRMPQREAEAFIADLENSGATEIERAPVDVSGRVEVVWQDSALVQERHARDMAAWRGPLALAFLVLGVVLAALLLVA